MHSTVTAEIVLESTLEQAYRRLGVAGGSVLLAVSGGPDSTALLVGTARVSERLALRVEVATLDHGLRPESQTEVEAVARLAAHWGLPCHVRALGLRPGPGLEARARQARYAALESLRQERGLHAVATGHTASDQAETLLMRLVRGTALRGAAGIHASRPHLIRPLLGCTRQHVEAYLAAQGLEAAADPMNEDLSFLRSRIRHQVLPALERAAGFPVAEHLASFARLAAEEEALLGSLADAAWQRLQLAGGGVDAVGLRALEPPLRRRVLARLLAEAGAPVDEATLGRAQEAVALGKAATLGAGLQLRSAGGRVRCVRPDPTARAQLGLTLAGEGPRCLQEGTGWAFQVASLPPPPGLLGLPLPEHTHWPLRVRTRLPGDRVRGPQGSRKLQDLLVDRRIPAELRDRLPVVVDSVGELLWVPGLWSAPRVSATSHYLWAWPPQPSTRQGAPLYAVRQLSSPGFPSQNS